MFNITVQGDSFDELVDKFDELHRVLQQARPRTRRSRDQMHEMVARANVIGLRRAAAEFHVSPSWLSRIRNGKLIPKIGGPDAAAVSGD